MNVRLLGSGRANSRGSVVASVVNRTLLFGRPHIFVYVFSIRQTSETIYCCHLHISPTCVSKEPANHPFPMGKYEQWHIAEGLGFGIYPEELNPQMHWGFIFIPLQMCSIIQHGPALVVFSLSPNSSCDLQQVCTTHALRAVWGPAQSVHHGGNSSLLSGPAQPLACIHCSATTKPAAQHNSPSLNIAQASTKFVDANDLGMCLRAGWVIQQGRTATMMAHCRSPYELCCTTRVCRLEMPDLDAKINFKS